MVSDFLFLVKGCKADWRMKKTNKKPNVPKLKTQRWKIKNPTFWRGALSTNAVIEVLGFTTPDGNKQMPDWNKTSSGKNSWYFHTLGYETIFLQKSNFFHTQKVLFHIPSKTISYPEFFFHTFKFIFIPWKLFSYPYTKISYLVNDFFHTLKNNFIP